MGPTIEPLYDFAVLWFSLSFANFYQTFIGNLCIPPAHGGLLLLCIYVLMHHKHDQSRHEYRLKSIVL